MHPIFHSSNPEKFQSRTYNLVFQGIEGGKDLFKCKLGPLMEYIKVVCDGVDYTTHLKKAKAHCILFLNIKSYAGGTRPWKKSTSAFRPAEMNDGWLEVIALDNLDLALLQVGGHGINICQCKEAVIETTRACPMQIDGEPFRLRPSTIKLNKDISKAPMANMLLRDKTKTHLSRDEELEEWAVTTIQKSFRGSFEKGRRIRKI